MSLLLSFGIYPFFLMISLLILIIQVLVEAFPEMWINTCQPEIGDTVMATRIVDDSIPNRCNLSLSLTQNGTSWLNTMNTTQTYFIQVRPNFGGNYIHFLLSVTTGQISLGTGYGYKDRCSGQSGILWKGQTDPNGAALISFKFSPIGTPNVKFAVTCSEGIGTQVYQHYLLVGNYTLPPAEEGDASLALAVVILLMVIVPMAGLVIYLIIFKCKPLVKNWLANQDQPMKTSSRSNLETDENEEKSSKRKDKYQNLKEET